MKRFMVCIAAAAVLSSVVPSVAIAEVNEITIAQQYGIAYLQFLVMQRDKLIEKHAKANGLGDVSVTWRKFAGSNVMYDAVFSGDLQIASGGLTPLLTVWAQTATNYKVRGIAAMNTMPLLLNLPARQLEWRSRRSRRNRSIPADSRSFAVNKR